MLRRFVCVSAAAVVLFGAAAKKPLKIALVTWRGETEAETGFRDQLKELGYKVDFTVLDANQSREQLAGLLRQNVKPGTFDYVYTFGTTASLTTKAFLQRSTPQIFNIVTAPVEAELVKNIDTPGDNVSGVCNFAPLELQIENAMKIVTFSRLGYVYNPKEKNSDIVRASLEALGRKRGFSVVDLRLLPDKVGVDANFAKLVARKTEFDAVYVGSDSFLGSIAPTIGKQLLDAKIISISGMLQMLENGFLLGTVPDYRTLGGLAAKIVDRNQKGEELGTIPVQSQDRPPLVVNDKTRALLGITIPSNIKPQVRLMN